MDIKNFINKNLSYLENNEWDKFFPINLYELMYLEDVNELIEKLIDSKIPIQPEIAFKNFTNIIPMIGESENSIWQQMSSDLSKILNLNITDKFSDNDLTDVWECCKKSSFEDLIDVSSLEYVYDDCEFASFEIKLTTISDHTIQFRLFARGHSSENYLKAYFSTRELHDQIFYLPRVGYAYNKEKLIKLRNIILKNILQYRGS